VIIRTCKRTELINAPIWRSQESPFCKFRLICMVKIGNHCSGLMLAPAKDETRKAAQVCSHEFLISTRLIEVRQRTNNTVFCIGKINGNETFLAHVLVCQISCDPKTRFGWNTHSVHVRFAICFERVLYVFRLTEFICATKSHDRNFCLS